jgi:hypothetical protein
MTLSSTARSGTIDEAVDFVIERPRAAGLVGFLNALDNHMYSHNFHFESIHISFFHHLSTGSIPGFTSTNVPKASACLSLDYTSLGLPQRHWISFWAILRRSWFSHQKKSRLRCGKGVHEAKHGDLRSHAAARSYKMMLR